ncbi:MAG: DNA mismatch repair protein MutT [Bacteroidetes bacterium]|nr:MAG: DNA mismatch repair protein MutT [Bacteroidota bacterium]
MEGSNPWKILGEKAIYENNWISLTEYDVLNPNGGKGIYGKIHYKSLAVGILPLDEEMNTYLVGQYRFPLNSFSWEIPEGGGDLQVDPLESAKRELREETGLVASKWTILQTMHLSNSVSDEFAIIFLARNLEQHDAKPEETEKLIIKKLPFSEAYSMVHKGQITDSMSVASILRLQLLLTEGGLEG